MISYGSVCSGIEAATEAWHPLGWSADWYAEIEPFPSAVLAHHYPDTPNHGDMTRLAAMVLSGKIPAPEVLVGGTPCQAFSVAGMREGLADPRGALTIKYVELLDAIDHVRTKRGQPEATCLWENVPGVLSDKGNAFGCFLGALVGESEELQPPGGKWKDAGCVYGPTRTVAWRVLDAQYFGLAQRRRRVFVVASARAGFDPLEVLFEREGVRRDTPPRRGEGQDVAGTLASRTEGGGFPGTDEALAGYIQPTAFGGGRTGGSIEVAATLVAKGQKCDFEVESFVVHGTQDPDVRINQAHTLGRNNGQENAVCITGAIAHTLKGEGFDASEDGTGRGQPMVNGDAGVRRLTPFECELLQGFPGDHTLIPYRGKTAEECPDGPRYKAIGNSKAVFVVRWIGQRIQQQLDRLDE
ncbi:DNA cytosine methyltransferase [Pseudomonas sp. V104_10]|uniref:DNA cytosine methyltransferase n=1 Tax=Pseudomonas sp. V104_10 TaxID=3044231 RepID=UPI00249F2E8D|nr:DNA cytosine methyltransferase [Pseudomonas sp. V104_10]MDI3370437.1 DNA cytosine methyltransferase [Pseudomonas sp. V104_10]